MFLEYQDEAQKQGHDITKLQYVYRSVAQNKETKRVVKSILRSVGIESGRPHAWPGRNFGMDTDEGKAILATPNGVGVAWLLFQHKEQFGRKTIKSVDVFLDNEPPPKEYKGPCLRFNLEDVD